MSWYNFLSYCIHLFYCAVHCYLFFCVLLLVMYVYLTVYIVLQHCHRVYRQSQLICVYVCTYLSIYLRGTR